MKLQYFGHSFWCIYTSEVSIVIDPFDNIGYPMPENLSADYVIVSHEHHDHNNVSLIKGAPHVIRTSGLHQFKGGSAELISVYHDAEMGAKRGNNNIIRLNIDGYTLVHCGDLGHLPSQNVLQKINEPDMLLIPVGEVYTLSLQQVTAMIKAIRPRLIFPMHYQTQPLSFKLGTLEEFTSDANDVVRNNSNIIEITPELLSAEKTIIMDWKSED
jgi:L-ascorbate metabolism protein UlaG (beta-lactamase superfamily)